MRFALPTNYELELAKAGLREGQRVMNPRFGEDSPYGTNMTISLDAGKAIKDIMELEIAHNEAERAMDAIDQFPRSKHGMVLEALVASGVLLGMRVMWDRLAADQREANMAAGQPAPEPGDGIIEDLRHAIQG